MEASLTVKALRAGGLPDPITGTVAPTTSSSSSSQSQSLDRGSDVVHCGLREVLRGVLYLNLPNPTLEIWEERERERERDTRTKRNKRLHRTQHSSTLINVWSLTLPFLSPSSKSLSSLSCSGLSSGKPRMAAASCGRILYPSSSTSPTGIAYDIIITSLKPRTLIISTGAYLLRITDGVIGGVLVPR